jgi:hypothetical protein
MCESLLFTVIVYREASYFKIVTRHVIVVLSERRNLTMNSGIGIDGEATEPPKE